MPLTSIEEASEKCRAQADRLREFVEPVVTRIQQAVVHAGCVGVPLHRGYFIEPIHEAASTGSRMHLVKRNEQGLELLSYGPDINVMHLLTLCEDVRDGLEEEVVDRLNEISARSRNEILKLQEFLPAHTSNHIMP
ncbi:MAG: hypothetical protein JWN98_1992 [Abditibacteriota bacterium]|nr:hypothetical protein [Abditibacteriota bacterium]